MLTDQEVADRTAITVKMANVAGTSAQDVSDQLTAVWNNFYDGSKSLEYFADVMVRLGADTASSTDEISEGLNKFAAVAETVGLSYEYAAAALATVTAETRESADIVGNAYKTLFARIQGLQQGDTLDDGTDLNKYSQALETVGINIFDTTGELKDMDIILDELGAKWSTLGRNQQTALAQTVGGARQYTQLIALMDNWDVFQRNLASAYGATGSLDEQAEIYEESWRAASDRVRAALEGIYDDLINDEAFIDILNVIEDIITGVDKLIDSFGGLGGVISGLGIIVTKNLHQNLAQELNNLAYNVRMNTKAGKQEIQNQKFEAMAGLANAYAEKNDLSDSGKLYYELLEVQQTYTKGQDKITDQQREILALLMDEVKVYNEIAIAAEEAYVKSSNQIEDMRMNIANKSKLSYGDTAQKLGDLYKIKTVNSQNLEGIKDIENLDFNTLINSLTGLSGKEISWSSGSGKRKKYKDNFNLQKIFKDFEGKQNKTEQDIKDFYTEIDNIISKILKKKIQTTSHQLSNGQTKVSVEEIEKYLEAQEKIIDVEEERDESVTAFRSKVENLRKEINTAIPKVRSWSDEIIYAGQSISQISFGLSSLKGAIDILNNTELSFFEKIISITPSLLFGLQSLFQGFQGIGQLGIWSNLQESLDIFATKTTNTIVITNSFKESVVKAGVGLFKWIKANPLLAIGLGILAQVLKILIKEITEFIENLPENKLETIKNEATKLAEEADKAATALNSIKDAFNGYDTIRDKLANCARGTEEWNEALRENNNYVLELLDKYPQLASIEGAITSEGGMLSISEDAIEDIQTQAETKAGVALAAKVAGNQALREAEIDVLISERTNRAMKIDRGTIGNYYDKDTYLFDEKKYEDYIRETLLNVPETAGLYKIQEKYIKEQIEQAKDYIEIEKQIQEAKDANNRATEAETEAILASVISYNSKVQESGYNSEITQFASQYNNLDESIEAEETRLWRADDSYLEQLYLDYLKANYGNASLNDGTFTYNDGENVVTKDFEDSKGEIIGTLASNSVISDYNTQLDKLAESLNNIPEEDRKFILALISGDTSGLTIAEFEKLQEFDLSKYKDNTELNTALAEVSGNKVNNINQFNSKDLDYDYVGRKNRIQSSGKDLADKYGIDFEEFKIYRNDILKSNKALEDNIELTNELVKTQLRLARGVNNLSDDWEELNKLITSSYREDVAKGIAQAKESIMDIMDLDEEEWSLLPDGFVEENWEKFKQVKDGSKEALEEIKESFGEELVLKFSIENKVDEGLKSSIEQAHQIITDFNNNNPTIKIGDSIDDSAFIEACNDIIANANMTAQQAQLYFQKMGYDIELEPVIRIVEIPRITTLSDGSSFAYNETFPLKTYAIKVITANGNYGGKTGGYKSSSGGSGSSSKPAEKVDRTQKSDVIERYKEINDSIDDMADALEDANKASDRLYGANRLKMMQQQNKTIQNEIDLLKEKARQAKSYYDIDKAALEQAAKDAGLNFTFDSEGNISNYTSEMEKIFNQLAAAEAKMDTLKTKEAQDKYEESTVKPIQDKIEALKEAISQYDETRELYEDLENELDDKFYEWQDNNYEQLTYKLEIEVEILDLEQEEIDYYLAKMENDFFKAAEGAVILGTTVDVLNDKQQTLAEHIAGLEEQYKKGEISQADFVEGMKQAQADSLNLAKSYLDLQDQMVDYYSNTLAAAGEELAIYTDQMENHNKVLEHYMTLMELTGQETNYKKMASVLQGQVEVAKNAVETNKAYADILVAEAAIRKKELDELDEGSEEWLFARETWLAAEQAAQDALDNMYNATADWIEKEKTLIEVEMEGFTKDLEKALTGGVTFDDLNQAMERAQSTQEDYLTTTNKIYETTKLMRTAQNALNETSNTVAKERIKQFINETKQLQEQNKLSNFELEIQQAKYNLLLAEIALEEARNAKSIVRLQRDSEGNFGYVYTADSDAIADAQQKYEDAENDLYNIRLNGAEEFNNKYYQIMQEGYDALRELDEKRLNDSTMTEEEYNAKRLEILEYYSDRMKDIQDLYGIATQEDARVIADSWTTEFADLIGEKGIEGWHQATADYFDSVSPRLENWAKVIAAANETIGTSYDETSEKVKEIVDENERLLEIILGGDGKEGVIDAIEQEIGVVSKLATTWAEATDAMMDYIKALEEQAEKAKETVETHTKEETQDNLPEQQIPDITTETPSEPKTETSAPAAPPEVKVGSRVTLKPGTQWHTNSGGGKAYSIPKLTGYIDEINGNKYGYLFYSDDYGYGWIQKSDIVGYDTGGYTGAWGPTGKLAMLHQKELVLNESDTTNFLASLDILHNIIKMIDVRAASTQLGGILSSPGFSNSANNNLEQTVHITASFPNATNSSEIEEAFNNLILNQATQFANRI